MDIKLELTGTTPLLMHNISLADPDNPFVKEIQTYTSKRKKTEDDRRRSSGWSGSAVCTWRTGRS